MPVSPRRRRVLFRLTVAAAVAITGVVAFVLLTNSLENNDAYSSIAGILLSLVTTFVTLALVLRRPEPPLQVDAAASDLVDRLRTQWDQEIRHRRERFGDARTIPLTWAEAPALTADPASVFGSATPVGEVRLKLSGRLDDNPDKAGKQLAEAFEEITSKRLVVLGEPGSGKTFLGITLTTGLLRAWTPGKPVPVFLSLSSWDPVTEPLDSWLVQELSTHYGGEERTPRALLAHPRLLPVLDGLDELPEHLRRSAIGRINDLLVGDQPLILTCRSAEYTDEITGGAPKLLRAPVVEIRPVSRADIEAQLDQDPAWKAAVNHVRQAKTSPFVTALGTPLMLSLFKSAYAGRDPAELFDQTRFDTRHAVEDHLIDTMIKTAYTEEATNSRRHRWTADEAWQWLSYLANYLHKHGERDLNWWQLASRTLSPWAAVAVGLPVGFAAVVVTEVLDDTVLDFWSTRGLVEEILSSPSLPGTIFGSVVAALWLAGARQTTVRRGRVPERDRRRPGLAALTGAALVFLPGFLLWLTWTNTRTASDTTESTALLGALLALSLVASAAVGWPELPTRKLRRSAPPDPTALFRRERRSALLSAGATALIVATSAVLTTTIAAALGGHLGQRIALLLSQPAIVRLHLPPVETHVPWTLGWNGLPSLIVISVLLGALFALGILTIRAWPRFAVARLRLAVRGELPWQLMEFLADARDRGLLRVAGSSYQFWHVRLQERLVAVPHQPEPTNSRRWNHLPALMTVVLAASAVLAIVSVEPNDCRHVGIGQVDDRAQRVVIGDISGCYITLTAEDWTDLDVGPADRDALTELKTAKSGSVQTVMVVGELDRVQAPEWSQILAGLSKANEADDNELIVRLVQKDIGDLRAVDANRLTFEYFRSGSAGAPRLTVLDLDGGKSELNDYGSQAIIANTDLDFRALTDAYREALVAYAITYASAGSTPPVIADGLDDQECATIGRFRATDRVFTFDLRRIAPTVQLLNRLSQCGGGEAIVAADQVQFLSSVVRNLPKVTLTRIDDESPTILTDCGVTSVPSTLAERTCVATLAGVTDFRMSTTAVKEE
ncbi:NACHT domain-containing protein [Amycolatopsis sp. FBCC-B4732]|uniref:NACHT domain-containing protein n=1 Tax=Amycolatopsis sp. FBCC-B4732 TaxID=3079339 RepID=UPI001FF5B6D3|nr:NACHT domain-containing protein [Amycolatopsis sp. FBCC-B4732]UOX85768.1 NACHT domain-containing protein [Amycolatopsis sp. FBCC-B4732]